MPAMAILRLLRIFGDMAHQKRRRDRRAAAAANNANSGGLRQRLLTDCWGGNGAAPPPGAPKPVGAAALPEDVLRLVLLHLLRLCHGGNGCGHARRVCRQWRRLLDHLTESVAAHGLEQDDGGGSGSQQQQQGAAAGAGQQGQGDSGSPPDKGPSSSRAQHPTDEEVARLVSVREGRGRGGRTWTHCQGGTQQQGRNALLACPTHPRSLQARRHSPSQLAAAAVQQGLNTNELVDLAGSRSCRAMRACGVAAGRQRSGWPIASTLRLGMWGHHQCPFNRRLVCICRSLEPAAGDPSPAAPKPSPCT